ncbi:hypothetical protein Tco_0547882 [Tanacetum coccineum]
METEVAKCSVQRKTFEIKEKELLIENDRLLELIMSQDLVHNAVNSLAKIINYQSMEKSFLDEYSKCVELKVELSKKNEMAALEFPTFFEINEFKSQLQAKNNSISKLKDHIATLKGKGVSEGVKSETTSKVITLGMYNLDLEPLSPIFLRNREAHVDYLKYTQEHADTLCEIVEHGRVLRPLDSDLNSALISSTSASRSKPPGNTNKNRILRPTSSNMKNKVEDQLWSVKTCLNKMNRVSEPICNVNVKHYVLNANSELICATCNECMFDAIHDLCVLEYVNDVNVLVKSKSVKSRKKKVWKPTRKVYVNVGYSWKPTGQNFTIDRNTCPLTRIISTTVVPSKKPLSTIVVKKTPSSSNTSMKLKDITNVGSSSKSKNVQAKISNNSEPNKNWGSNVSTPVSISGHSNRPLVPGLGLLQAHDGATLSAHQLKLKPKADIGIFIGYTPAKKDYRIYNRRTCLIMETIHVEFDELTAMASKQFGSGPELQLMTPGTISSGLVQNPPSTTPYVPPTKNDWDLLLQQMFNEYFNPPPSVVSLVHAVTAPRPVDTTGTPLSTSNEHDAPAASTPSTTQETQSLVLSKGFEEVLR